MPRTASPNYSMFPAFMLVLLACNTTIAYGENPVSAEDIKAEKAIYTTEICRDKLAAWQFAKTIHREATTQLALRGASAIENKLIACQPDETTLPEIQAGFLPKPTIDSARRLKHVDGLIHRIPPAFKGRVYVDLDRKINPETRFTNEDVRTGVLVLHPLGLKDVPAILTAEEVIDYYLARTQQGLPPGSYFAFLHNPEYSVEKLARLRYYDYADSRSERRQFTLYEAWYFAANQ